MLVHVPSKNSALDTKVDVYCTKIESVIYLYNLNTGSLSLKKKKKRKERKEKKKKNLEKRAALYG